MNQPSRHDNNSTLCFHVEPHQLSSDYMVDSAHLLKELSHKRYCRVRLDEAFTITVESDAKK
jgi:hypothetical protein